MDAKQKLASLRKHRRFLVSLNQRSATGTVQNAAIAKTDAQIKKLQAKLAQPK